MGTVELYETLEDIQGRIHRLITAKVSTLDSTDEYCSAFAKGMLTAKDLIKELLVSIQEEIDEDE